MASQTKTFLTPEEYLTIERQAETKSEYFDGEMFLMVGASREHNLIAVNIAGELRQQLKKRECEVYSTNMRTLIPATGLYTYPDVIVVCGEPQFEDDNVDTLLNPTLIVEVLSESTGKYGRGKKFGHYLSIRSLAEYVMVTQDEYKVEVFTKQLDGRWLLSSDVSGLDATVELPSIECSLKLREVYDKVVLP